MKNKVLSVLLVTAMVATMLVGCGDSKKETTDNKTSDKKTEADAGDDAKEVTLKTVSMFDGTDANQKAYIAINDQYKKDHPNVTLEDNSQKADQAWKASVAADFAVGQEPDVIQYFTDAQADTVVATDKLMTLEDIQKEYPEYGKETTEAALKASANTDGVNRALPTTGYWEGLFCNTDLFEQYNVEIPTDWDSLVAAIKTFKENGITPVAVSLNQEPHYWLEHFILYTAGLDSYKSIPETAPEDWVKGVETLKTLRDLGAFPEDTDSVDTAIVTELFTGKKAAMMLDGSWRLGSVVDAGNGDTTTVVAFPGVENQKAEANTLVSGVSSGFYITKKAWDDPDKREAAVQYVMAHTGKEGITKYWEANGKACVTGVDMGEPEGLTKLGQDALKLVADAKALVPATDSRIGQDPWTAVTSKASTISVGESSAADALNEALNLYKEVSANAK